MSRRKLQSNNSQYELRKHKAIIYRTFVALICLTAAGAAVALLGGYISRAAAQGTTTGIWEDVAESSIPNRGQRGVMPRAYRILRLNKDALRALLADAPMEFTREANAAPVTISLPMPDGTFGRFKVVESPMMEAQLAAKHPDYKTYSGTGVDDPAAITRFGITASGFHAIILAPSGTVYIDPYAKGDTEHYISYYKRDYPKVGEPFRCNTESDPSVSQTRPERIEPNFVSFGFVRNYRLAMAATSSYTEFFRLPGDTDVQARDRAFNEIVKTVNRVNSVYGRDLGVRLVLINNEKDIIYVPGNDPYTAAPGTQAILDENQANLDDEIGNDNYDIGHVVGANGSGLAQLPSVCLDDDKAKGSSGLADPAMDPFDIDYVAHEIGHQLNAQHTFNDGTTGSCGGNNRAAGSAYEPGSGSTIMAYAGICPLGGGGANLQLNSDDYFHAKSVEDIRFYVHDPGGDGSTCGDPVPTGNLGLNPTISLIRTIPSLTPFRLYAGDFADPDPGDVITHTWEEYDLGLPSPPEGDGGDRPIFRSYKPVRDSDRTLPSLQYILNNANGPPPTYNCAPPGQPPVNCLTGEILPVNTRTMFFRLTLRDNRDAVAILDNVTINIRSDSGPFVVIGPGSWPQGAQRTVTWNVANTNSPPVNCANVKISLSTDGGNTFSFVLAESTPNDGSETITVPQVNTTQARIKVEAVGNIFFDITDGNFSITSPMVTTTDDGSGDNLSPVSGSLREAIIAANNLDASAGPIPILFNIPGGPTVKTINLQKELPAIDNSVFIDGWSQGGAGYTGPPLIELNGQFAQPAIPNQTVNGLLINSGGSGSRVRGLIINRFTGIGILMSGSSNCIVEGCYIGTDAAGAARAPNGGDGIRIGNGSGNKIGRTGAGEGNLISGNGTIGGSDGIEIVGSASSGNIVQNNLIGTNAAGTAILHNLGAGVHIINAPGTIIGGPGDATRNIISGASGGTAAHGIHIEGISASGTLIRGNYIGTNAAGTADLGNIGSGIYINNAPNTVIGGLVLNQINERNVISGNDNGAQIYITGSSASGTQIKGNYVGLNAAGDAIINSGSIPLGIHIESNGNTIGGTGLGDRNVISGHQIGIDLSFSGAGCPCASGNVVQGNYIGTDKTGTVDLGNSTGINIFLGRNNLIGGTSPAARNLISGNNQAGITITGNSPNPAEGNLIQGNYIGTNAAGTAALGFDGTGIVLSGVRNVTIGGTAPGAGNLISGNGNTLGASGVHIANPSTGIVVQGNLIGTDASGTAALGNLNSGILVAGSGSGVTIGGTSAAARNVISANTEYGIHLIGTAGGNVIRGNYIGTDITGTANLRNTQSGIWIGSNNNVIGGTSPGEGNLIAFNGINTNFSGIQVNGVGNSIRGNSIFSNTGLGIDIANLGITPNDACDPDGGFGNNSQNFPVLSAAINGVGNLRIEGSLNSTASSTFTLDFYSNPACDTSGNGEGKTYLGSATVASAANCVASFTGENAITLSGVTVPAGQFVTATATDMAGNTSEFSACIQVTGLCATISPTSQSFTMMGGSGSVNVTAAAGCNWTATSNAAWIIIVSEAGDAGNGVVSYEVRENFDAASRTGTMTISQQVFTVTQSGNCTYSIAPAQRSHPAAGGAGTINVTTDAGCNWTAVSNAAWITITSGNGTGNGVVNYTVAANPGPGGRSGTITVGGRAFTVKQKG